MERKRKWTEVTVNETVSTKAPIRELVVVGWFEVALVEGVGVRIE